MTDKDQKKDEEELALAQICQELQTVPLHDEKNHWHEFLCVEKLDRDAIVPTKGTELSAGFDIYAFEDQSINAWSMTPIRTNISIHLPPGVYGRVASRSGLSKNHNLEVGAGVIDPDYRGEIIVILRNFSDCAYNVKRGDRIAQLILEKYANVELKCTPSIKQLFKLSSTRGTGGFGSTGQGME